MCREEERPICGSGNGRRGDRMKVYTKKDLEGFERDDLGRLICPGGDYTRIKSFGKECSFGEGAALASDAALKGDAYLAADMLPSTVSEGRSERHTFSRIGTETSLSAQDAGSAIFPLSKNGCGMYTREPVMKRSTLLHAALRS